MTAHTVARVAEQTAVTLADASNVELIALNAIVLRLNRRHFAAMAVVREQRRWRSFGREQLCRRRRRRVHRRTPRAINKSPPQPIDNVECAVSTPRAPTSPPHAAKCTKVTRRRRQRQRRRRNRRQRSTRDALVDDCTSRSKRFVAACTSMTLRVRRSPKTRREQADVPAATCDADAAGVRSCATPTSASPLVMDTLVRHNLVNDARVTHSLHSRIVDDRWRVRRRQLDTRQSCQRQNVRRSSLFQRRMPKKMASPARVVFGSAHRRSSSER